MKPLTKIALLSIALLTGIALLRIISAQPAEPPTTQKTAASARQRYEPKENDGGDVTVTVTALTLKPGLPASFDIAFETHSVDLDFDVADVASLTDNHGTAYTPVWDGSPPGGHHRSGTLRFTPELTKPTSVTLTFSDISGVATRTFTWEVRK